MSSPPASFRSRATATRFVSAADPGAHQRRFRTKKAAKLSSTIEASPAGSRSHDHCGSDTHRRNRLSAPGRQLRAVAPVALHAPPDRDALARARHAPSRTRSPSGVTAWTTYFPHRRLLTRPPSRNALI